MSKTFDSASDSTTEAWMDWFFTEPCDRFNFWIAFNKVWPDNSAEDFKALRIWNRHNKKESVREIIESFTPENAELFWTSVYATRLRGG